MNYLYIDNPHNQTSSLNHKYVQRLVVSGFVRSNISTTPGEATPPLPRASSGADVTGTQSKQLVGKLVERAYRSVESDEGTQIIIVKVNIPRVDIT